jgi:hypothetical protein
MNRLLLATSHQLQYGQSKIRKYHFLNLTEDIRLLGQDRYLCQYILENVS